MTPALPTACRSDLARVADATRPKSSRPARKAQLCFRFSLVPHVALGQARGRWLNSNTGAKRNGRKCVRFFLVGVTGFEPAIALPRRIVVSAFRHSLSADTPCFVGKNFEKTPHRGVFPSFSLDHEPLFRDNQRNRGCKSNRCNRKREGRFLSETSFSFLVGVTGFEPAASWSRTKRSTELSHTPLSYLIILFCSPYTESPLSHPIKPHRTYLF